MGPIELNISVGISLLNIILTVAGPVSVLTGWCEESHLFLSEAGKLACNVRDTTFTIDFRLTRLPIDYSTSSTLFAVPVCYSSSSSPNVRWRL